MGYFYPRSPCGERLFSFLGAYLGCIFLSTLSLRRATPAGAAFLILYQDFYPRSPCGERLGQFQWILLVGYFYPRSPCGERQCARGPQRGKAPFLSTLSLRRATYWATRARAAQLFLSTLSLRRATRPCDYTSPLTCISIHALLAESDRHWQTGHRRTRQFLSTLSLRRATRHWQTGHRRQRQFLSTLSLRRATVRARAAEGQRPISIHALLAESDPAAWRCCARACTFLSTLSLRRATAKVHKTVGHFCAYETNFMEIASSC